MNIDDIKARHERYDTAIYDAQGIDLSLPHQQVHQDRAWLLAEVERLEEAFRLLNIAWIDEGERAEAAEAALERVKRLPKYDIAEVRRYGGYHDTKWMKAADVLEALEKDDE